MKTSAQLARRGGRSPRSIPSAPSRSFDSDLSISPQDESVRLADINDQPSTFCSGFTLLELLVVTGIIVLLLAAIMPAVNSLSKSNGRQAAIANLLGGIEQARAEAIKSGQATYVVFPTFGAGTGQGFLDRYNFRWFAVFAGDRLNPATLKQISGWKIVLRGWLLRFA